VRGSGKWSFLRPKKGSATANPFFLRLTCKVDLCFHFDDFFIENLLECFKHVGYYKVVTGSELTIGSIPQCNGGAESVVVEFEPGEVLFGFV